jgi:hypothetical protein
MFLLWVKLSSIPANENSRPNCLYPPYEFPRCTGRVPGLRVRGPLSATSQALIFDGVSARLFAAKKTTPAAARRGHRCTSRAGRGEVYLRDAHAYMLISMPTDTSTIFGVFQLIHFSHEVPIRGVAPGVEPRATADTAQGGLPSRTLLGGSGRAAPGRCRIGLAWSAKRSRLGRG